MNEQNIVVRRDGCFFCCLPLLLLFGLGALGLIALLLAAFIQ